MFIDLIRLHWKSFKRNPALNQNILISVAMGLMAIYFGLVFIMIGAGLPYMMSKPETPIGPMIIGAYYLIFIILLFFIKLIFQNFGFKDFQKYLMHGFSKKDLIHFVILKTLFHWTHILPLLGVLAYIASFYVLIDDNSVLLPTSILMIALLYFTNYLAFFIDKCIHLNKVYSLLALVVFILVIWLGYSGYIPLINWLGNTFKFLSSNILLTSIPILATLFLVFISKSIMLNNLYFEDGKSSNDYIGLGISQGTFAQFGEVGDMMELEAKMLIRNNRSRSQMLLMLLFIGYPFLMKGESFAMLCFVSIFCTGGLAMTIGQLFLSWHSSHLDLLLTRMSSLNILFTAKYYILVLMVFISTLLMTLFGFYKVEYFYLMPLMGLYNIGVVIFMYMLLASYNAKKIDTSKGPMMNYEGVSVGLFLIVIPIMIIPISAYYIGSYLGDDMFGVYFVGLLGLLGFIFHKRLISVAVGLFQDNKYKIGSAFRKK